MNEKTSHLRDRGTVPVPISILDQLPMGALRTATESLRASTALAVLADRSGFHRYWVAEHHSSAAAASSSPSIVLAHLAAHTTRIRLGSGGIMLPNYAPLLVAEQFGTLAALAPGRIDLGVGRAFGTDKMTAAALRRDGRPQEGNDFPQQISELIGFLHTGFAHDHPYANIYAVPGLLHNEAARHVPGADESAAWQPPPIWILGSTPTSARLAGSLGLPYSYAAHIAPAEIEASLNAYRSTFVPSPWLAQPYVSISVNAFAAEQEREAMGELLTGALTQLRTRTGWNGFIPSVAEARRFSLSPDDRNVIAHALKHSVYGTADDVKTGLLELVKRTDADELLLAAFTHCPEARLHSYELIAHAYDS